MISASSSTRTVAALAGTAKQKKSISPYSERRIRWQSAPRTPSAAKMAPSEVNSNTGSATPPAAGMTPTLPAAKTGPAEGMANDANAQTGSAQPPVFPYRKDLYWKDGKPFGVNDAPQTLGDLLRVLERSEDAQRKCAAKAQYEGQTNPAADWWNIQAQAYCFNPDPATHRVSTFWRLDAMPSSGAN